MDGNINPIRFKRNMGKERNYKWYGDKPYIYLAHNTEKMRPYKNKNRGER